MARSPERPPPAPVRGPPPGTVARVRRSLSREGDAEAVASDTYDCGKRTNAGATRGGDRLGGLDFGGTSVSVLARYRQDLSSGKLVFHLMEDGTAGHERTLDVLGPG
uniref:Uncharacterized protein n=1 Tax=Human betaherpesvirus 6A TaxID=32603 RepID=Q69580_9BETA|nr:unnamed protein product [Human betaherpesvirus 6A]